MRKDKTRWQENGQKKREKKAGRTKVKGKGIEQELSRLQGVRQAKLLLTVL